ncbi:MAG: hypothetical protein ACREO8_09530, partial [Luteimonas sp.]
MNRRPPPAAAAPPHHTDRDPAGRREPSIGSLADLDFRRDVAASRSTSHSAAKRAWWPWPLGVLVVLIGLAVVFRQPLADVLWPQTRAQALRMQAAAALQQGRLSAADGSGARELYAAALAIDPDRSEALQGLRRVAQAALARA